jgi:hypothetical protein
VNCPHCQESACFKEYRRCRVQTLFGTASYSRAYYHCRHCHQGWFPTDEEFGIERKETRAAQELETLAGILHPFAEGAEQVLERMSGMRVSASTVQRTTEAVGAEMAARQEAGQTPEPPQKPWGWARDATGQRVGYISLDATSVPQQGPHGEKVEGRMPYVAAVFNPQPRRARTRAARRLWDVHYLAGLLSLEEAGQRLRREAQAVAMKQCDLVICLTDGGNGLENCLTRALGGVARQMQFILDFHHAADHVTEFSKLLWADDSPTREAHTADWCHQLKTQGGERLLEILQQLDLSQAPSHVVDSHRRLTSYVTTNLHRMDYPRYITNGWQIGSGVVESACKTVVCRRLKQSGMRWREPGTHSLCHLRAMYLSSDQRWEHYWSPVTAS